jgi:hypothetical protein
MTIPAAPTESGGDKLLFVVDDNGGTNRANLMRGYKRTTLNSEGVADIGVYPTSGTLAHGNRNATGTAQLQLTGTSTPCQGVLIKAREANVNDVWVGKTGLTADTTEATGGYRLAAGQSVGVPCRNANEVYLRWATYKAGDGVEWIASAD